MQAFGPEHMSLLASGRAALPDRSSALDRWFRVAYPKLLRWTGRVLNTEPDDQREDAFAYALLKLHDKTRSPGFEVPASGALAYLRRVWKNLLVDWLRKRKRHRSREVVKVRDDGQVEVENLEDTPYLGPDASDPSSGDAEARVAVLGAWREWPVPAVSRLICACEAIPEDVTALDVQAAVETSRTVIKTAKDGSRKGSRQGLTRDAAETWALLRPWQELWSRRRALGAVAMSPAIATALAHALRGPPGHTDPTTWPEAERDAALTWLYQQRSRTKKRLEQRLAPMLAEQEA